ncbi:hypothetical protein D9758_012379 [Tetrapyrgos nigripes]|uniref:Uncharacterized protein n=1 Tax=Tetrapyrgos nigripes TaxID=182062 RepID=A0A8H5D839_9AGAR|nr:hypothetical protein D9758_012379 [Tetrapyrgos nigripes]
MSSPPAKMSYNDQYGNANTKLSALACFSAEPKNMANETKLSETSPSVLESTLPESLLPLVSVTRTLPAQLITEEEFITGVRLDRSRSF